MLPRTFRHWIVPLAGLWEGKGDAEVVETFGLEDGIKGLAEYSVIVVDQEQQI